MKKATVILLICVNASICFAQSFTKKETLIPLDNTKGVPFYKDGELNDLIINGFEIDSKGNFYFMAGDKSACLAGFSGNKQLYRKSYHDFSAGQLYFCDNKLYTFDRLGNQNLIGLSLPEGLVITKYNHIINQNPGRYFFTDNSLIIEIIAMPDNTFEQYSLTGQPIKQAPNMYNIDPAIIPAKSKTKSYKLLGAWNENYVFWALTGINLETQTFCLVSKKGETLAKKVLPNNNIIFGDGYAGNQDEYMKVRNANLYVLGRKNKSALVTEVPLSSLFDK